MSSFQGHRVSFTWSVILAEIDRQPAFQHLPFRLNSGQRTLAEQQALYTLNMFPNGTRRPGRPLTARPNPNAPHIKEGHENHALDLDSLNNGENRVQAYLHEHGVPHAVNNVSSEVWHLDPTDEAELKALANRILAQRYITLGTTGRKQLGLKKNLVTLGYLKSFHEGPFGKPAVAALKHFQRDHELVADGVAGPLTLKAIKAALRRKKKR